MSPSTHVSGTRHPVRTRETGDIQTKNPGRVSRQEMMKPLFFPSSRRRLAPESWSPRPSRRLAPWRFAHSVALCLRGISARPEGQWLRMPWTVLSISVALMWLAACGCLGDTREEPRPEEPRADSSQPFTPCCRGETRPPPIEDPDMPADGPGPFLSLEIDRVFYDADRYLPSWMCLSRTA